LINEHLNQKGKQAGNPELLPRDPAAFRKHMARLPIQQSAFSQFYLKEAMKQERTKQIWDEIAEKKKVHDLEAIPQLERELEEILQKQEKENEDVINLS
jgi:DNA-binding IclR family transcriptional regulator